MQRIWLMPLVIVIGFMQPEFLWGSDTGVVRVRAIELDVQDVYGHKDEADNLLYKTVNALHYRTRDHIIRRELLIAPGDPLDLELVAESERNLRALKFISEATITVVPVNATEVDLYVFTGDKFTLRLELSGGYTGGVAKGRASIGEGNLFGLGKSLRVVETRREGKTVDRIQYEDPRLFGTRWTLRSRYALGTVDVTDGTESIQLIEAVAERPFYSLDTRWSYGGSFLAEDGLATFFEGDIDETTDVLTENLTTGAFLSRRWGERMESRSLTARASYKDLAYGEVSGSQAGEIEIPADSTTVSVAADGALHRIYRFEERERLDSLAGIEDVAVSWNAGLTLGVGHRRDSEGDVSVPLLHGVDANTVFAPFDKDLVACTLHAFGRYYSGDYLGTELSAVFHNYYQGFPEQTIASNVSFDAVYEGEELRREITLGEESGLRGYDAKEFSGNRRFLVNLEDRVFTPIDFYSIRLGFVGFFDMGYVWPQGEPMTIDDLKESVGVGLRIGSVPLLKRQVIRVDLAFPLSSDKLGSATLSISAGQIFELLKNNDALEEEF